MVEHKEIEKVIEEKVRPYLQEHYGDIEVVDFKDGVLQVRLLGSCGGCPSAQLTMESIVEKELTDAFPDDIKSVSMVDDLSDELYNMAKDILSGKKKLQ